MPKSKRDKDKPRGRTTAFGYFLQACFKSLRDRCPNRRGVFEGYTRVCFKRWNEMAEWQRQHFEKKSDVDKERYDKEMREYYIRTNDKSKLGDPVDKDAPRRPLSAFFWFCDEKRQSVKEENPEFSLGELSKRMGEMWWQMPPSTKKIYSFLAARDTARYQQEMKAYEREKAKEKANLQKCAGGKSDDDKAGATHNLNNEEDEREDTKDEDIETSTTASSDDDDDDDAVDED